MTKPAEPIYIAQTAERMPHAIALRAWFKARQEEAARDYGCTFFRTSMHQETDPPMLLVEGWVTRPAEEGEPRWMLVAADG